MTYLQHGAALLVLGCSPFLLPQRSSTQMGSWRTSWAASPSTWLPTNPVKPPVPASLKMLAETEGAQTIRNVVHVSSGGEKCRLRISNVFGREPLFITDVHVALQTAKSGTVAASDHPATFDGKTTIEIPPGADVLTDAVLTRVPAGANLSVSLVTKGRKPSLPIPFLALQTSYVAPGDQAVSESLTEAVSIPSWPFLTEVQVSRHPTAGGTVVAFGDSITDGALTTSDTNRRWPDRLRERFVEKGLDLAVTDAGIAGNRMLHDAQGDYGTVFGINALARFDRDVLAQAGVSYVVILLGINDIAQPGSGGMPMDSVVSVEEIEFALSQLAERAHEHGIRVLVGTLLPFGGAAPPGYFTSEKEQKRQDVNRWIRGKKAFDGFVDFDKAVQDPADKTRMRPAFDGGDHLHPNDAGDKAMADAIPLEFFASAQWRK